MRNSYQFQWFEPEDACRGLRASISREGKLRLGRSLRAVLPPSIRIGFDIKRKVLAIADGHGRGIQCPKGGMITARGPSHQITSLGLELPISFRITPDASTGYFLGRIIPRPKRGANGCGVEFDWNQITIIYQHILETAISQMAKTTPLAERKELAREALITAVQQYRPGYGEIESYLETQVRSTLIQENKFYTSSFRQQSLDQPLTSFQRTPFCLYDTLEASTDGGLAAAEDRIMAEQFWDRLSAMERKLLQMLQDGMPLPQIAAHLRVTEDKLTEIAHIIAEKRRDFYAA